MTTSTGIAYKYVTFMISLSQIGLESVIWNTEAVTNFIQCSLKDSAKRPSLLNTEVILLRTAVLQNRMALTVLLGAQRGTHIFIKTCALSTYPE